MYGESGNKQVIDCQFDLAIAMISLEAHREEGQALLEKTLFDHKEFVNNI